MSEMALAYENGMFISTPAFGLPMQRQYEYMDEPVTFYEHCHDEPLQYGMNAEKYFKGCKNAFLNMREQVWILPSHFIRQVC